MARLMSWTCLALRDTGALDIKVSATAPMEVNDISAGPPLRRTTKLRNQTVG